MEMKITNKPKEMEQIGEAIVLSKPEIYTEKMLKSITNIVQKTVNASSDKDALSLVYRSIYDYWMYGVATDEFFYYGFRDLCHEEKKTYMTNRWRVIYIDHLNDKEYRHLLENKYEGYKLLKKYYLRDVIEIKSEMDLPLFLDFIKIHSSFVVKPGGLALGIGVYKVEKQDYSNPEVLFRKILKDNEQYARKYHWSYSNSVVIEELIQQDKSMAILHPYSVNSVRITTVRTGENDVTIIHPWLKIGAKGQFITSAAFGTLDACIDPKTGVVETKGYMESRESFEFHPDTGEKILGYHVPRWEEAVSLAKSLALSIDHLRYVGWDLVLTTKGWCVMEGNVYGDFMWQLCYNKGMKAEFEQEIGWKSDKQYWWE